jgi:SOS-response transcriptional repressor LexA
MELTDKQRATLGFVYRFIQAHGYPPTSREVAKVAGVCEKVARERLNTLGMKGLLRRTGGGHRMMTITPAGHEELQRKDSAV